MKRNQTLNQHYAQLLQGSADCRAHRVSVSWLLNSPTVFAGELPAMSVCLWMFNCLQTFMGCSLKTALFGQKKKKASVRSSRVKQNSKVCWKDLQSSIHEAAESADNCLRYRPDI